MKQSAILYSLGTLVDDVMQALIIEGNLNERLIIGITGGPNHP
jgi:hypothetical protein